MKTSSLRCCRLHGSDGVSPPPLARSYQPDFAPCTLHNTCFKHKIHFEVVSPPPDLPLGLDSENEAPILARVLSSLHCCRLHGSTLCILHFAQYTMHMTHCKYDSFHIVLSTVHRVKLHIIAVSSSSAVCMFWCSVNVFACILLYQPLSLNTLHIVSIKYTFQQIHR